jgi:hypothetical protein
MLHPTASIFSPTFQKYLNLILREFFRNDVKVHMLYTCGRILVGTDYYSWNFIMTQISTSTLTHMNLPNFSILSLQTILMDVNGYPMIAPNPFKWLSYERTKLAAI